jgi:hypothetical protein
VATPDEVGELAFDLGAGGPVVGFPGRVALTGAGGGEAGLVMAIPVKRTWQYTLKRVATSWQAIFGTGIGASAIAVTAWVAKRRRRKANESVTPTALDPDPQVEKATLRG